MAGEQMDLADILDGKEPPKREQRQEARTEQAETPPAEAKRETPAPSGEDMSGRRQFQNREQEARAAGEGKVRDPETGKFVAKAETPPAEPAKEPAKETKQEAKPTQEELTPKERAAFAKAADETRKRQALEQELAQLKAQRAAPQATQQQPQADPNAAPKTFWDDPEGNLRNFEQRLVHTITGQSLNVSEALARQRHEDFDEKVVAFANAVKQNPMLNQQMLQSANPGEFAYVTGKEILDRAQWQQAGGLDGLRKQMEAEIRAKVDAELKEKGQERPAAAVPRSLAETPGKGMSRPTWGGPDSLDSILKH